MSEKDILKLAAVTMANPEIANETRWRASYKMLQKIPYYTFSRLDQMQIFNGNKTFDSFGS